MKRCAWCKQPLAPGQRKYCSDACSYAMQRVQVKVQAAGERAPKRTFRYRPLSVEPPPQA